ncbi:MAG TPA: TonB family protein [Pyrinomonadaceae bacterium]|nr:TonB family protein [Pyrinomonadaceae bacterium]
MILTVTQKLVNNSRTMVKKAFPIRFISFYLYLLWFVVLAMLLGSGSQCFAQQGADISKTLSSTEIERIIKAFTTKEAEFRRALNEYNFKRDALLQTVGMGGQITGEYHRVSNFTFDDQGIRYEKITLFPMPSYPGVTPEDLEDLGGVNPYALEPSKADQYNFRYVGKERIDELDLYVFDVTPKVVPDPKKTKQRLFLGRVWVDDHDLQIVKTRGKGVPETKINKFPNVETYREEIDGHYWFPTYSYADEELIFDNGEPLHIRMKVRYSDFVVGHSKVKITEAEGPSPTPAAAKPTPSPQASGTPAKGQTTETVKGGVLNSKAIELPDPEYPEEARRARAGGRVLVSVVVDETGKVISAEVEDGPILFRRAALEAARKARFRPLLVDGQPVKVSGVLQYLFAP